MATVAQSSDPAPPLVRDVDFELLAGTPDGVHLPYLPRSVDARLDQALAKSGVVILRHQPASGVRRTAYEALLRVRPTSELLIDVELSRVRLLSPTSSNDMVLWLDKQLKLSPLSEKDLNLIEAWLPRQRLVLAIIGDHDRYATTNLAALGSLSPTTIDVSAILTEDELAAANDLDQDIGDIRTIVGFLDAAGTGDRSAPIPAHAASYRADTDAGPDQLGITADVRMLADLVASRLISPPLSIGLFGNWGSGKSFFMRRMRERVRELAGAAATAEQEAGVRGRSVSSYCSAVRQITFNAWHYVEGNLWASLATQIFDSLAAEGSDDDLLRRADELAKRRERERSLLGQLSAVRLERMTVAARQERQEQWPNARALAKALRELTKDDLSWVTDEEGAATAEDVPVFVVVVGVDPRWLGRSIRQHYPESGTTVAMGYLEKIFQIPFVLPDMNSDGFNKLIDELAKVDDGAPAPDSTDEPGVPTAEPPPVGMALGASPVGGPPPPVVPAGSPLVADLLPRQLVVAKHELAFLGRLAPLVPTPRAAKRLVNLYRLVRARLSGAELDRFLTDVDGHAPYQAVLLLLTVLVGRPDTATALFQAVADEANSTLAAVLEDNLRQITEHAGLPQDLDVYRPWLGLVSRFSFTVA